MLTFLSVILAVPIFDVVATASSGVLGESFEILVFYAYPILIIWLIYKTIAAML